MTISSISDLAQSLQLRRDNADLRSRLMEATRELSTGRSADLVGKFGGDFAPLSDIEVGLKRTESFLNNISEQRLRYQSAQAALGTIRDITGQVAGPLILVQETSDADLVRNAARDALARFDSVVGALNSSISSATLFAGVSSDAPALAPADTILAALESDVAAAGAATAEDVAAVVAAWFDTGGGFDTVAYLGGVAATNGLPVSETAMAAPLVTAADPTIRDVLESLALAALAGRGALDGAPEEQARLTRASGLRLMTADEGLVELMADIGTQESRIARAEAETRARRESLEMARNDLVGVDPYDAATRLQATEAQLESLYAMTARLSRLSLTDYLR